MNKLLRVYLILVATAMFGAFIVQVFMPQSGASGTAWGLAQGWQREIGFWNVTMIIIVIGVLAKGEEALARIVTAALVVMCFLFGTNHLSAVIFNEIKLWNLVGAAENYIGVIVGLTALLIKDKGMKIG